jgi:hypothetical protein
MNDTFSATSAKETYKHDLPLGGHIPVNYPIDFCPPNTLSLSQRTMYGLERELRGYGCYSSSSSTRRGLEAVAECLEQMTEGRAKPRLYLSSVDPGVGKTTLIRHYILSLLASSNHEGVAVLVCLSRLEEVKRMAMGLSSILDEVAIWTGDDEVNALSTTPRQSARVLITTQQKLEAACRHSRNFNSVSDYHYQGLPREVRIWDESFMPGVELMLSEDDLASLWGLFRRSAPKLCQALQDLRDALKASRSGEVLAVPSLEEMGGMKGVYEVNRLLADKCFSGTDRERLERLQQAAGENLPVHRNAFGNAMLLDYRETLPQDLFPLLVLDASGRCRETYKLMESRGDTLVRLPSATKRYDNLSIHLWSTGSGKAAYANDKDEVLIRGIAAQMAKRPTEDWLIIHNKAAAEDMRERLEAHLDGCMTGTLHFVTWGNHHGTNAYAHVPNVVLASLFNLPPEVNEARVRLCAAMAGGDAVSAKQINSMALGEHLHNALQAICRGAVRGLQPDGTCPPCRVYLIAPKRSGIREAIPDLFPGAQIAEWMPEGATRLSKSIAAALAIIDAALHDDLGDEWTYAELAKSIGMSPKDFKKRVAKDPRFQREIADRGYFEDVILVQTPKGERQANGIVLEQSAFGPC